MQKELGVINNILISMKIDPISENTAREWDIVGGESFEELEEMTRTYAGHVEQNRVEAEYYQNTTRY